ncbi:hypothetical protein JQ544_25400 [Bradyrhizobium diazoefficiens]|nr:hypothetical protein [Bradyrhizobium diazoefficiens]MBR0814890.1 hypothetical protein [Bradyrhizobium diazoefficiens]
MVAQNELLKSELRLIGLIVQHWSYLEHAIEKVIWETLRLDHAMGRCVTEDIQFRHRSKMLGKLIQAQHLPIFDVWKNVASDLQALEEQRNLIVHGLWQRVDGVPHAVAYSLRKRRKGDPPSKVYGEGFPPDRMQEIDERISAACHYLDELKGVIAHANEASRKKSEKPTQIR